MKRFYNFILPLFHCWLGHCFVLFCFVFFLFCFNSFRVFVPFATISLCESRIIFSSPIKAKISESYQSTGATADTEPARRFHVLTKSWTKSKSKKVTATLCLYLWFTLLFKIHFTVLKWTLIVQFIFHCSFINWSVQFGLR